MEFKCASCQSRFSEWGKKKGKFGGSIHCCLIVVKQIRYLHGMQKKKNGKK